jgi:acetylornithine/N-succinyldiaminopimelate aminotransferase
VSDGWARVLADARVMPTYRRAPVTFVRGSGAYLYDEAGRKYLDFVAGVAVNALGHSHPAVVEAISQQAGTLIHTSNLYYTEPMALVASRICGLLGWDDGRVFFTNSGAEAIECAIKLVRKWADTKHGHFNYGTIATVGSFHGRTYGALSATGQPGKWKAFLPLVPGFTHVAYGDAAAVEQAVTGAQSSVLVEPVQGEGGVVVPPDGYLPALKDICDRHRMALVVDEVQTGLGRTGEWFGFQAAGVVPDVITLAKALGNGLPIGACVARGELATAFQPGDHATTVGGGPLVCAASLAVIDTIDSENLVENSRVMGEHLFGRLQEVASRHDGVVDVRGKGLLIGVELAGDTAAGVADAALAEGLLVNAVTPSVIRLCPPLIVDAAQCDSAVDILDAAVARVFKDQP